MAELVRVVAWSEVKRGDMVLHKGVFCRVTAIGPDADPEFILVDMIKPGQGYRTAQVQADWLIAARLTAEQKAAVFDGWRRFFDG